MMAVANPDWYFRKRMQAGLEVDFLNPAQGIGALIITKVIVIAGLIWAGWHIATKAGYL